MSGAYTAVLSLCHKTSEIHLNYRRLGSGMKKELPDSELVVKGDTTKQLCD